jgi:MYXO-CTERM domain-containing protein
MLGLAAIVALLSVGAAQAAATPCWKQVINDWYDGRIDRVYACDCYREALRHLPSDTPTYSTAKRDIQRAFDRCRASATADAPSPHRNYVADAVAAVLAIVAAVLLVRRRRSVFKTRR